MQLFSTLKKIKGYLFFLTCLVSTTSFASAHEVYVLGKETIERDIAGQSPNPFSILATDGNQFILWGVICALSVILVLFFSLTKKFERFFDPSLFSIKRFAPVIARVTFGICLIASGYYSALFGPELPFSNFAGSSADELTLLLYALGVLIILGIFTRVSSFIVLLIFAYAVIDYGTYMLTYANYLGEIVVNLILGGGTYSVGHHLFSKNYLDKLFRPYERYAFFLLRVLFGIAVAYASFFAKFLHSQLALDVVTGYNLTDYFHFVPLFIVLGAFIIEMLIGVFFIIGFEVRFTALVFLAFLGLSLSYFGEAVWPHLVLVGVNLALFAHGYDSLTVEKQLFKQEKGLEPVL